MKTKRILLSLLTLLVSVGVNAYDAKVNGIYYSFYTPYGSSTGEATVTFQSLVSTKDGGSVPSGYDYYTSRDIVGWEYDEDEDESYPIYGPDYQIYYTSDYSGAITIPSTVSYNGKTYNVIRIQNHAFENCSATSITIEHPIPNIYENAFSNYRGTLTINTPILSYYNTYYDDDGDPYYTEYYPFNNKSFKNLNFGNSVTSIPDSTFRNCKNLSSFTIPSSLTSIGRSAFAGCSSLHSLTIPNWITSIGSYAFNGCNNLAVIDINASSLTSIGEGAFGGCSKLKTVNLNSIASWMNCTLSNASSSPFYNGADLYVDNEEKTTISFPVTTSKIPAYAFYGCRNITSVTIPAQVTTIGTQAFGNCPSLTAININSNNSNYSSEDGILYNANKTTLLSCIGGKTGAVTVPPTVTSISASAFYNCSGITSLTLPSSLTSIGSSAFSGCKGTLTVNCNIPNASYASSPFYGSSFSSVTFGNGVTSIGSYAFYGCTGITSITLPSSLTSIGNYAFYGCTGITSITLPSSLTSIGNYAFYNAKGITSITLPSSLTSIGGAAFSYCTGITSITLPSSLTSIGNSAFYGCKGALTVNCNIPNAGDPYSSPFYGSSFSSVTFGNGVTSVGSYAFYGCTGITSLTLPSSLTSIGSSAFSGCTGITSLTLPSSLTSIGGSAFYGCTGITSLTLPSSLTSIGGSAFYNCTGITSLTLPSSLTSIGNYAFQYCSGITSLTLPSSLTSIGGSAFYGCKGTLTVNCNIPNASSSSSPFYGSSFSSVTFGNGVTSIGSYAFYYRSSITSITFPSSLTSIGNNAFQNCSGITSVTVPNTLSTTVGTNAFSGCSGIAMVNTKISDISSISSDRTISFLPASATWNYYLNDNLLTTLDIPSSVTSIGNYAFYNAKGITSITFPSSLTSIGNNAFQDCSGITSIALPGSLTSIGSYAFSGCTPTAFICKAATPPTLGSNNSFGGQKKIYVPYKSMDAYKSAWSQLSTPTYTYLPLLDVMFFETQSAASYASELTNKDKSQITSVAFYEGGLDNDLTESVMKAGMNPNCLYYVPASAGLSGDNIVTLDSYLAESVTLTDNYTYDCPIPFHTEEIKYVHNPSVWANGSAGWETICLPFAPETFEASEQGFISPIMLGSKGNFWLRKFVGASSDAVYFASTIDGQMEANTPYLVAFPGSTMGTGHLQGQTITFTGYDKNIQVTEQPTVRNNDFVFVGNYDKEADGIEGWALNAAGSSFARSTSVGNQPFRAYFKNLSGQISNARLRIDFSDPTDVRSLRTASSDISLAAIGNGELVIQSKSNRPLSIYTVDGRLVRRVQLAIGENRIDGLHKGLYIVDNHKIMMR